MNKRGESRLAAEVMLSPSGFWLCSLHGEDGFRLVQGKSLAWDAAGKLCR